MTKSQVGVYLRVMQGFRKDILATYPSLKGVDLDFERIALGCQTRGHAYFMLDLPHLESLLLEGLETGRLTLEGPSSRRVSSKVRVPRLFAGLWLRVFDKSGCLRTDADVTSILDLRQLLTFGKKLEVECSKQRKLAAYERYHDIERSLRKPSLSWDCDKLGTDNHDLDFSLADCLDHGDPGSFDFEDRTSRPKGGDHDPIQYLLGQCQKIADIVSTELPFCEPVSFSEGRLSAGRGSGCKHGPGAVAERLRGLEKFSFPYWTAKLEDWFPVDVFARLASQRGSGFINHEPPSQLHMVPKTAKSPRIIASEPVAHQWCQQLTWLWLRRNIRNSFLGDFIDFSDQNASGNLVLQASQDRKLATVDLSDASDRLSCWTVERMFRRNPSLLSVLHAARTRWLRTQLDEVVDDLKLKKFASQGTAVTFPVQSLVFLIIAFASVVEGTPTIRKLRKLRNQVRVYGDDIIIPARGFVRIKSILDALQLKVNLSKSYERGSFRESCGQDAFRGVCITPVKPKTIIADGPASCQAVIDTTNNLFNKGYWNASNNLQRTLPVHVQRGQRVSHSQSAGAQGFTSFMGDSERHLQRRWNSSLHIFEVRTWTHSVSYSKTTHCNRDSALLAFLARGRVQILPQVWESRDSSSGASRPKTRSGFRWEPSHTPVIVVSHRRTA